MAIIDSIRVRDLSRFFGDVYLRDEELASRGSWVPPVDIYETDGHDLVHQGGAAGHEPRGHRGHRREQHAHAQGDQESSDAT